jgi:putative iron-regulated protein
MIRWKVWTGVGTCVIAGSLAAVPAAHAAVPRASLASAIGSALGTAASEPATGTVEGGEGGEEGEGGEGGEAGGIVPSQYELFLAEGAIEPYDARVQILAHADLVHRSYGDAERAATELAQAIDALLAAPDQSHLDAARIAWLSARRPYLRTEAFRFYDGPIDRPEGEGHAAGPEPRINAWPLNEAVIDYVEGDPKAGLVNAVDVPLTRASILSRDQVSDEADVTTGWHAIEFLLWGQDRAADGPGTRPPSDFAPGDAANDRRRTYLKELVKLLREDLAGLLREWDRGRAGSYGAWFAALPQTEALGRAITGAATLAGVELASERLTVALDSGSQEDEQSCFSDSTRQDFIEGVAGIRAVWLAGSDRVPDASLAALVATRDPALAARIKGLFADADARVAALAQPFDSVLAQAPGSKARADAEGASEALRSLAIGLRDAGRSLGVLVIVPGIQ